MGAPARGYRAAMGDVLPLTHPHHRPAPPRRRPVPELLWREIARVLSRGGLFVHETRVSQLLERRVELEVRVQRVNPPPVPSHERVLCVLTAQSAVDAVAFRDGDFRPLASDATDIDDRAEGPIASVAAG